jgi:hypothetical protein
VFQASQKPGQFIDPDDPTLTLDDYEDIMDREKHIKGYYSSYLERWGRRRRIAKPKGKKRTKAYKLKKKLLKDHPERKLKYIPRKGYNTYENEMMNIRDFPEESDEEEAYSEDRSEDQIDMNDEESRRKNWKFNTNYQDMFNDCVGDRERGDSIEKQARDAMENRGDSPVVEQTRDYPTENKRKKR